MRHGAVLLRIVVLLLLLVSIIDAVGLRLQRLSCGAESSAGGGH